MNARRMLLIGMAGVVLLLAGCSMGSLMIQERRSPYDFDRTVALVQENARAQGWLVPKVHNFQQSLVKHGQPDPGRLTVIKLCKPEFATRMFGSDDTKYVSVMAPCSISVYEKTDGNTYVASMRMGLIGHLMGAEVGRVMADVDADDRQILRFLEQTD
ncbi:DUF302 domain-containing protein [Thiohalocapsa marina]|uniref:DUF302 domain-containing protein n=1 Tax=Thiohalocapsa marina TaxID=424902 RepID=UPI0036DE93D3